MFQLTSKIQTYKLQGRAGVYFSEGFVAPTEDTTDPEPFAIQDFFNALYFNNDNTDFDEQPRMNPYLSRMASLVVSASVELELRRLSPKDPEAKKLVNHLDAMKDCERTLL